MALSRDIGEGLSDGELREYAARMSEAERIAHFGVFRWEIATGRVRWSDELHRIYGLRPGEFAGTVEGFVAFLDPDDWKRISTDIDRSVRTMEPFIFEERIRRADGQERVLLSRGWPVAGEDGQAVAVVGVCHDVTERVMAERALGFSERRMRAIMDYSPSIIAVKDLSGSYLMTNRETGRLVGIPPDELVGRECTELFPSIAEQLREGDRRAAVEMEPVYDEAVLMVDGELRTFLTTTFALPDEGGKPVETCTIATDITERRERERQRRERRNWEERIASTLAEGRMLAFAQPVVELNHAATTISWRELLVRKMQRSGQLLEPTAFLPAAERYGLIQSIDVWMVKQALRAGPGLSHCAVNLSAVTLRDPDARQEILGLLRASPESAKSVVFEITETADPGHLDAACQFAEELVALGVGGLALDDFGVGFGAFTYLRRLPLSYLKIDRSFVTGLVRSRDDQRVVKSIVEIARQFGLRTIAEGIEDLATLNMLRDMDVHYGQGFYLGRPTQV
jgi:PAS domain S-box-containing protein